MTSPQYGSPPTAPQRVQQSYPETDPINIRPQQPIRRAEPKPFGAKFNFARGFWTAAGVLVAWLAAMLVFFVVMLVLGMLFRGVTGLGNLGQAWSPQSQSSNCGVNPNTGLVECR